MPQSPIMTLGYGQTPTATVKPVQVDASGRVILSNTQAGSTYKTIAASQSAQALGTGAIGDVLEKIIIVPETAAAGAVSIVDGSGGSAVTIQLTPGGGTTAFPSLAPIVVEINAASVVGGWHVTTGANVHVLAVGQFTV